MISIKTLKTPLMETVKLGMWTSSEIMLNFISGAGMLVTRPCPRMVRIEL